MKSILYVEDELLSCVLMEKIWKSLKIKENLIIVHNYDEAIKVILNKKIDLIITNISLPGNDGTILIKKVKEIDTTIPIVVLSNYNSLSIELSEEIEFISKPFYEKDIKELLIKYLN